MIYERRHPDDFDRLFAEITALLGDVSMNSGTGILDIPEKMRQRHALERRDANIEDALRNGPYDFNDFQARNLVERGTPSIETQTREVNGQVLTTHGIWLSASIEENAISPDAPEQQLTAKIGDVFMGECHPVLSFTSEQVYVVYEQAMQAQQYYRSGLLSPRDYES